MYEIKARMLQPPAARSDGYGLDHDIQIAIINGDERNLAHYPCAIELDDFAALLQQPTNAERIALYKSLIIQYYNAAVPSPIIPQAPSSLSNLPAWDAYYDALDAYETQLAADVAQAETLATQATSWIEGLGAFSGWPFDFVLQEAS